MQHSLYDMLFVLKKARRYYEEQAGKATEVLNLIAKLWGAAKEAQDEEM